MIDYDRLLNWKFEDMHAEYSVRDTMLYALGLGIGADPTSENDLRFVYEDGLVAFPTMPLVLANVVGWLRHPDTGVDYTKVLHGDQSLEILAPLPPEGHVISRARVTSVVDKGKDRGAIIFVERALHDAATDQLLARTTASSFARANGGFNGPETESPKPHALPDRAPDRFVDIVTLPQAALLYRLSGDYNPVHADPATASKAGFPRPIAHGLFSFGIAARGILSAMCPDEPQRLSRIAARFSAPAFPGERMRTEIWEEGGAISFRVVAPDRNAVIVNNGSAFIR